MQSRTPTIHCDAEDGECGTWEVDYYAACVSAVNDIPITLSRRAPGWLCDDEQDLCPEHAHGTQSWIDKHGDVWRMGDDGLLHTPETRPFPRDHVEKKWGPLRPAKEANRVL